MDEMKVFDSEEFGSIRTVEVNGAVHFVATDVARALGYAKPLNAVMEHCRYTLKWGIPHPQNKNKVLEVNVIPQGDVVRLAVKSKLKGADRFERWVFDEVVPSVLNHGIYATESVIDEILENPDFGIELLTKLKEERAARMEAERKNAILMHVSKTYTMTEIAKELGMRSATELNRILAEFHIQYKVNGTWVLYSDFSGLGYEEIKQEVLDNGKVVYHRRITQSGREFILNLFERRG